MVINSIAAIYFSPTGTTKKILYAIIQGMGIDNFNNIDITLPDGRNGNTPIINEDILIIGVPVYEERIPKALNLFLNNLKNNRKPVALVAVYGNIGQGIALNELKTITENSGYKVAAAASFIGEHSFSSEELPIAKGRPDQNDLIKAHDFGKMIINKLKTADDLDEVSTLISQGRLPLMAKILPENSARMFTRAPSADMSICSRCGVCAKLCPMGAIDKNTLKVDDNKCLRCFCCVRKCSRKARKIIYKKRFLVTRILTAKGKVKKEPVMYL